VAASVEEEAATEVMEVASLIHAADDGAPCTYIDDKGYLSTAAGTRSGISVDCCRLGAPPTMQACSRPLQRVVLLQIHRVIKRLSVCRRWLTMSADCMVCSNPDWRLEQQRGHEMNASITMTTFDTSILL
jgi:hypothetical protein